MSPHRLTSIPIVCIAAAFALPVAASAVGTFSDEVPSLGGIVVPSGDPQALAAALHRQIETPLPIHNNQETFEELAPRFMDMYRKVVA